MKATGRHDAKKKGSGHGKRGLQALTKTRGFNRTETMLIHADPISGASSGLSVFVLDVEILGITCVTGPSNFLRFLGSASAFPLASLVLVACWATTQSWSKICQCRRLQRLQAAVCEDWGSCLWPGLDILVTAGSKLAFRHRDIRHRLASKSGRSDHGGCTKQPTPSASSCRSTDRVEWSSSEPISLSG